VFGRQGDRFDSYALARAG